MLRGWPDAEWRLLREEVKPGHQPPPDDPRFFSAGGRDVALHETQLAYDKETRRLSVAGGNRKQHAANKHLPTVLQVLKDNRVKRHVLYGLYQVLLFLVLELLPMIIGGGD